MKDVLVWSLGIGGAIAVYVLVLLATGPGHSDLLYNADLILLPIGVVSMHRFLRNRRGVELDYRRALATGAIATVIAGCISRGAYFLYLELVDDSLFGMIADQWRAHLESQGLGAAEIQQRISAMDFSAWNFASGNLIAFLVPGLVLVALASIFTRSRKRPRSQEEATAAAY